MLEEIYDIAPGAQLYFYTAGQSQDDMVTAINRLQLNGCNIMVDDVGFTDEPFFQDGVISTAINKFVSAGGSYVSAIGNDGNSGYLRQNVQYIPANGGTFVNFAPTGATPDSNLRFTLSSTANITLEWDNPFNGDSGRASSDLDLLIYNAQGSQLVAESNNNNLLTGLPAEDLTLGAGSYTMRIQLAALATGAKPPDMVKFVASTDGAGRLRN